MNILFLFGSFDPASSAVRERLILLGVVLLAATVTIVGVILRRRLGRRRSRRYGHSRHRRRYHHTETGGAEIEQMISEKPHRHRREHRPRNPTLAETGGLPPLRSDAPLETLQPRAQP
jgi:hypothetical protein